MSNDSKGSQTSIISRITVAGFKSIGDEWSIEIRPLTVLAGANSSGKSSIMQAVLMLKQTLDATYDPGPLLLDGPHVRFENVDEFFSHSAGQGHRETLEIGVQLNKGLGWSAIFRKPPKPGPYPLELVGNRYSSESAQHEPVLLTESSCDSDMRTILQNFAHLQIFGHLPELSRHPDNPEIYAVHRSRFLLAPGAGKSAATGQFSFTFPIQLDVDVCQQLQRIIHVPGFRGGIGRSFSLASIQQPLPGTFDNYFAAFIAHWQANDAQQLLTLQRQLAELALTERIEAAKVSDAKVKLLVSRMPVGQASPDESGVNIADVGLGVTHALPVVVSLLAAEPGDLVYIEQPEIHLHPNAQVKLASTIGEAANRGVRVVIETHSSLLLLGIQAEVAKQKLSPDKVILHWFQRSKETGMTSINSAELDEAGRFGDWPVDFDDVALHAQDEYLDASESFLLKK